MQNYFRQNLRKILTALLVIILLFGAYQFYLSLHFRVVNTDPKLNNASVIAPLFIVNFNRQLSNKNFSYTADPAIIKSYKLDGKKIVFSLDSPLNEGQAYKIKINYISDAKGESLQNKLFRFTPRSIPYEKLSDTQKTAIMQNQRAKPTSKTFSNLSGTDALLNRGLTLTQVGDLQTAVHEFAPKAAGAAIDVSSLDVQTHDPYGDSNVDAAYFNLQVDKVSYKAKIEYYDLTKLKLYLYDSQTGNLVYQSYVIDSE